MESNRPEPVYFEEVRDFPEKPLQWFIDILAGVRPRVWMVLLCCCAAAVSFLWPPLAFADHGGKSDLVMFAILLSAVIANIGGFAFSAVASGSVLHLVSDPVQAVKVILVASIALQAYSVFTLRHSIEWRAVAPFFLGGVLFVPLGIYLLVHASAAAYWKGLGVFIMLYACAMMLRRNPACFRGNVFVDAGVGALGGITGGAAGFPSAFIAMWCGMRGWDKNRQRAVYQPYILAMQLVTLLGLELSGHVQSYDISLLEYVPAALLGASCGLAIFRRLTERHFSVAIYSLLILSGAELAMR